jgi:1,4-dihydroxy-2-naphthoate octaprenyltransferase
MAHTISFGPVKNSTQAQREQWLIKAKNEGLKLHRGALSEWNKLNIKTVAWLKAIRLQFYPMTFVAYAAGALGAESLGYQFQKPVFWLGYLWLFLIEVATVLTNDYYDFTSDKQNKYFSPFTGGSRVIVDKLLSFPEIKKGIFISLALSFVVLSLLLVNIPASLPTVLLTCSILFILALGYTVPPLRLSYRGLGELDEL